MSPIDPSAGFPAAAKCFPTGTSFSGETGGVAIGDLVTPIVVVNGGALQQNIRTMAAWAIEHAVSLRPHAKTTMCPQIWADQIAAGAVGLTVANPGQLKVAVAHGFDCVEVANEVVDPPGIRELAVAVTAGVDLYCWVDSEAAVTRLDRVLDDYGLTRSLKVLVDVGGPGGRTGTRTVEQSEQVAAACLRAKHLSLAGLCGYEGALVEQRSNEALALVRRYVLGILDLHALLRARYEVSRPVVSIGGSVFFDAVALSFAERREPDTDYVIRSGAYVIHDDLHYERLSPLSVSNNPANPARCLVPAARGYATVVSCPEPGLAILNGGRRDFPYDLDLPKPLVSYRDGAGLECSGWRVVKLNDQHAFVAVPEATDIQVGDLVMLGLSHPCTLMDKWTWLPVTDGWDPSSSVVSVLRTYF